MIDVDGPPEDWAGKVARIMVEHGATAEQLTTFFHAVFRPVP